jgi:hypothetical protein
MTVEVPRKPKVPPYEGYIEVEFFKKERYIQDLSKFQN